MLTLELLEVDGDCDMTVKARLVADSWLEVAVLVIASNELSVWELAELNNEVEIVLVTIWLTSELPKIVPREDIDELSSTVRDNDKSEVNIWLLPKLAEVVPSDDADGFDIAVSVDKVTGSETTVVEMMLPDCESWLVLSTIDSDEEATVTDGLEVEAKDCERVLTDCIVWL